MRLTTTEIAALAAGIHHGPERMVSCIETNIADLGSRPRPLFVAANHRFLLDDTNKHIARACREDHPYLCEVAPVGGTAIVVADAEAAMLRLGRRLRDRHDGPVVAVAGSVGKTTTKNLTAAAAGARFVAHYPRRSFNTEFSVPATILEAPEDTECLVLELSARYRIQLPRLMDVVRPDVGVLVRIAPAHIGTYGSMENIARTKADVVLQLDAAGTAVVSATDPWAARARAEVEAALLTYGEGGDVRPTRVAMGPDLSLRMEIATPWGDAEVEPPCRGLHMADNVLAAVAAAGALDVPLEDAVVGLEAAVLERHRMEVVALPGGGVVIDDTYNATPASIEAGLRSLAAMEVSRRVAVLGPIREGELHVEGVHRQAREVADELGIDLIAFRADAYGLPVIDDPGRLDALVFGDDPAAAVLVKGSRAAGMDRVVDTLTASAQNRAS